MKKIIKIISIIILILTIFIMGITLYIGNYLYDYTLNPHSNHSLFDSELYQKDTQDAQKWLEDKSVHLSISSYDDLFLHAYYLSLIHISEPTRLIILNKIIPFMPLWCMGIEEIVPALFHLSNIFMSRDIIF